MCKHTDIRGVGGSYVFAAFTSSTGCFIYNYKMNAPAWLYIYKCYLYAIHMVYWCMYTRHSFMQVYFMNNLPNENWRYENEPITKDKILEWANEWSTFPTPDLPDGNPVPKFVRVNEKTDSNIRVKFTGMHNTFWFPWVIWRCPRLSSK